MISEQRAPDETVQLGKRQTRQREVVFDVIRASSGPLTVPEIHAQAKKKIKGMGIATIYRTIKLLLEKQLIQPVTLPSGDTRYESAALGHHHHFQCNTCGKVIDIDHCPITIPTGSKLPGGYMLLDHEITLFGLCPKCQPTDT